jgi:hypothetical protein
MKVNNYLVTGANLATMGYRQKAGTTPPLDGSIMSKGEANTYYYIDPNVSPWSTYPDTRAPKYQDFPCPCVGGVTVENNLEYGFSQTISYQDCSGNTYYFYLPYGQAAAIIGCSTQEPSGIYTGCGILRGSVVGARLSVVNYQGCCYANYPCTTTSTTTIAQCNYNGLTIVCNTASTANLSWTFNESGVGVIGNMDLYVNGSVVESRSTNASGIYAVSMGDSIYVEVTTYGCTNPDNVANSYTSGIIADASCGNGSTTLYSATYIVTSGDIGNTLTLNVFSRCDGGCV